MTIYIGCDLGGTNIKAGLVNLETGSVIESRSIPTLSHEGQNKVMDRLIPLIQSLVDEGKSKSLDIQGIGVSAPGTLDLTNGKIVFLTNFPGQWRDFPLVEKLQSNLELPLSLLNDVRAITYGEFSFGAGKGVERMACIAIGTGVGGGLVINGELLLGFNGTAGELGHQTVEMNGNRCGCGNYGCLETYISGPAIASRAAKAVHQGFSTRIADLADYDLNKITPKIVAQAAREGDEIALEIWDIVGHYLGTGIANTCVSIGPQRVVLAGGVAAAGDLLINPVKETLNKRVHVMPIDQVEILTSTLGDDAGILGMASWAGSKQSKKTFQG
ncbi:MAG: ROK family protein [Chloroflexi bacterium]|nr:ROK family protein [Chloroflexota bacterium]